MRAAIAIAVLASTMTGCATFQPSLPEGYQGPVATIHDSAQSLESKKANLFFVTQVDGRKVKDSLTETIARNQGRGFSLSPFVLEHDVPAKPILVSLTGITHYAAPILALTGKVYQVEGTVSFTPEANQDYVVKGSLGPDVTAVWIEEKRSGKIVGRVDSQPKR
ncbi:MAG: hypothetical protein EKK52_21565 [Burkholderiales bacterium]|nr:MAG: hypothetical protein EKK52_21565 [Burkholderiales bacterium]